MNFHEQYPKDRIYAADFQGKAWTLTFRKHEPVTLDVMGQGGPTEKTMPVWHFEETPKKLPAVLTNGVCARALFGDESDDWAGRKITLYPAPDTSGLADDGLCIRVKGSPEIDRDLVFTVTIGRTKKTFTLLPTGKSRNTSRVEPSLAESEPSTSVESTDVLDSDSEDDIDAALDAPTPLDKMTRAAGLSASDGKLL